MTTEVIWQLDIDGTSAVLSLDEISAAIDALIQQISQVAAAAADLSTLDEALSSVASVAADATVATDGMTEAMASMSAQISDDTALISSLNETIINLEAQITALTLEESGASDATNVLTSAMTALGEVATGAGEALQAAQGPLLLISAGALMAGKSFMDMGMQGQDGIELVQALAGATTQDITALEQSAINLGVGMKQATDGMYMVASAGYMGSQGILVLDNTIKAAKGTYSQLGAVASVTTGIMHAYSLTAEQSGMVTDELIQTTKQGKQSFADLASAIGPVAAQSSHAGVSLSELLSAEAAMTQINPHVRQDTMQLTAIIKSMGLGVDETAKKAKGLGISFDEGAYKSMSFYDKLAYLRQQTLGNDAAFTKLVGGANGFAAALYILQGKGQAYRENLKAIQNSQGATDKKFEESEQTISAHLDKIGAAFSVLATKAVEALGPKITPMLEKVSAAVGQFTDFATHHIDQLMPVLAGLATFFGTIIVAAIAAFIGPMLVAAAPVLAVVAAIAALAAGVAYLAQHWTAITTALGHNAIFQQVQKALGAIGGYLTSIFLPVIQQLKMTWETQLVPAIKQLQPAFDALKPVLEFVGIIIGTVLVVALGLLVGVLTGVIKAAAALVSGLTQAFGGIVQMISGAVQIISGILGFLADLFTGNWSHMKKDMDVFVSGVVALFTGFGNIFMGIFGGLFNAVGALVSGFIDGVVGFFTRMYDAIVGHSIIPDMINGIINWFEQLPSRAMGAIASLGSQIGGFFSNLAGQALQWGSDLIGNIIAGINSMINGVRQAASNVASSIASILHHSTPEIGPLKDDDQWGADFVNNLTQGIESSTGRVRQAALGVAQSMTLAIAAPSIGVPSSTFSGGSSLTDSQGVAILSQILSVLMQINNKSGGGTSISMNNAISAPGVTDTQQLYNLLQSIGGFGYQNLQRGSFGL